MTSNNDLKGGYFIYETWRKCKSPLVFFYESREECLEIFQEMEMTKKKTSVLIWGFLPENVCITQLKIV